MSLVLDPEASQNGQIAGRSGSPSHGDHARSSTRRLTIPFNTVWRALQRRGRTEQSTRLQDTRKVSGMRFSISPLSVLLVAICLIVSPLSAAAWEEHHIDMYCSSGYDVTAYSRTYGAEYQNHYYSSLNSESTWHKSTHTTTLRSYSGFEDSYLSWYTDNAYVPGSRSVGCYT